MVRVSDDTRDWKVSGDLVVVLRDRIRTGTQVVGAFCWDDKEHRSRKAGNLIAGKGKTAGQEHWIWECYGVLKRTIPKEPDYRVKR